MASGVTLTIPDQTQNVEQAFAGWYASAASQQFGSLFTATVPFTLNGQIAGFSSLVNAIQSVTMTMTNHEGASSPLTVALQ